MEGARHCEVSTDSQGLLVKASRQRTCVKESTETWAEDVTIQRELARDFRPTYALGGGLGAVIAIAAGVTTDEEWSRISQEEASGEGEVASRQVTMGIGIAVAALGALLVIADSVAEIDSVERHTNKRVRGSVPVPCEPQALPFEPVALVIRGGQTLRRVTRVDGGVRIPWAEVELGGDEYGVPTPTTGIVEACGESQTISLRSHPALADRERSSATSDAVVKQKPDADCDRAIAALTAVGMTVFRGGEPGRHFDALPTIFLAESMRPSYLDASMPEDASAGRLYWSYEFRRSDSGQLEVCTTDQAGEQWCSTNATLAGSRECTTVCARFDKPHCGLVETRLLTSCFDPTTRRLDWLEDGAYLQGQLRSCEDSAPPRTAGSRSIYRSMGPLVPMAPR